MKVYGLRKDNKLVMIGDFLDIDDGEIEGYDGILTSRKQSVLEEVVQQHMMEDGYSIVRLEITIKKVKDVVVSDDGDED